MAGHHVRDEKAQAILAEIVRLLRLSELSLLKVLRDLPLPSEEELAAMRSGRREVTADILRLAEVWGAFKVIETLEEHVEFLLDEDEPPLPEAAVLAHVDQMATQRHSAEKTLHKLLGPP
jgi:hypothetical protein